MGTSALTDLFLSACERADLPASLHDQGTLSFAHTLNHPNHILDNGRSVFCEIIQLGLGTKQNIDHMVRAGADFTLTDKLNDTAMVLAVRYNRLNIIDTLLENGGYKYINPAPDHKFVGTSLLNICVKNKLYDLAKKFIQLGAHLHIRDHQGHTPLDLAVKTKDLTMTKILIDAGADVYKHEHQSGRSILHLAKGEQISPNDKGTKELQLLEMLLNAGADVDAGLKFDGQESPLIYYTDRRIFRAMEIVLNAGADVHVLDRFHQTPLVIAANQSNRQTTELLLEHGADINHMPHMGTTALGTSLYKKDNLAYIEYLLERGADVNQCSTTLGLLPYPLHLAVQQNNKECIDLLLKNNADPLVLNADKQTPLSFAIQKFGDNHTITARLKLATDAARLKKPHQKGLSL